jgi:hypothetical protein
VRPRRSVRNLPAGANDEPERAVCRRDVLSQRPDRCGHGGWFDAIFCGRKHVAEDASCATASSSNRRKQRSQEPNLPRSDLPRAILYFLPLAPELFSRRPNRATPKTQQRPGKHKEKRQLTPASTRRVPSTVEPLVRPNTRPHSIAGCPADGSVRCGSHGLPRILLISADQCGYPKQAPSASPDLKLTTGGLAAHSSWSTRHAVG